MPYIDHAIGSEHFAFLAGSPAVRQHVVEIIDKPGQDDVALRLMGQKCQPFQLRSERSVASITAGRTLMETYAAMKTSGPYTLIWEGITFTLKAAVLDVKQAELYVAASVGNVEAPTDTAWLAADWTLILVPEP